MGKKIKILVINCGSSSIKYRLYNFPESEEMNAGVIEKIGEKDSVIKNHKEGVEVLFNNLLKKNLIAKLEDIQAIGHRVVHGGENFNEPRLIDDKVIKKIKQCLKLAPLHNPANLAGIIACKKIITKVKQAAVFDTAFHHTIPEHTYLYPIPLNYYKKYGIRKYGFHGTSHQFVAQEAAKFLNRPLNKLKLITCHLGNGCSITAVDKGKSIDTSMGFTPLEGLMMGTRSGDIDPASVLYIMEKEGKSIREMDEILNKKSGLKGISGVSNDIRIIKEQIKKGNNSAKLAIEMFIYRIKKYIGAYLLILGRADAICFTAGIGENNPDIISRIKKDILKIAPKTKILVIPTNEELMIANLTYKLIIEN